MYEDILQLTPLPSIQDPRAPNSSSPVLSSSSSSSYRASSPVTPALRPLSLPVAVSEASLPPLQREEVGCGCDVVPVPLHHHSRELRTERPGAQPSPLQVGSVKCLENTALKSVISENRRCVFPIEGIRLLLTRCNQPTFHFIVRRFHSF